MEAGDLEALAEMLLRMAGCEPDQKPKLRQVAALVGKVEFGRGMWGDAELVRVGEEWRIYVKHGLGKERRVFAVFHEVAERYLKLEGCDSPHIEEFANYTAAAMVLPRQALWQALRAGLDRPALAKAFAATETLVALRTAETGGAPLAVVCPHKVYARGAARWPPPTQLRRLVREPEPGMIVVQLSDDPRRWVLNVNKDNDDT